MQFASAFVLVAAATAIGLILQRFLSAGSLLLPFLIAILLLSLIHIFSTRWRSAKEMSAFMG